MIASYKVDKKDRKRLTTHALLRYSQRFAPTLSIVETTRKCRNDLDRAYILDYEEVKNYLKKVDRQNFEKCHIYKEKVFLEKDNVIITTVTATQFFDDKYIEDLKKIVPKEQMPILGLI